MRLPRQSNLAWLALAALLLFGRRKRKHHDGPPGEKHPPGGHKIPRRLSLVQLRELSAAIGMAEPDVGAAVAMAESSGDSRAVGDKGQSIGLWQINIPSAPKEYKNRDMLFDPGFNAKAAMAMSNGGTNWSPWRAFTSGRYLRYMPAK